MTHVLWNYFFIGSLGVVLQITVKISRLKMISKNANHVFSFKEYLRDDWPAILGSFATLAIFCVCLDEILNLTPKISRYIKWLFVFVGFTGSSIAQTLLSATNRKIMAIIDVKTNIADGVKPVVTPENVEGVKEIIKEEQIKDNNIIT